MAVPGVAMHKVGIDVHGVEICAAPHCAERRIQRLWARKITRVQFEADDFEIALVDTLIVEATHFHRHGLCQFARKIAYVHSRAAVNVRGVLVGQEKDLHARFRSL